MWEKLYSLRLICKFVKHVFPLVNRELAYWHSYAEAYAEKELRLQALASIADKRFHCLGGSIYSLYPHVHMPSFVRLVTALQTISDYLDNLCDRTAIYDEQAFRQLHLAMTDALNPESSLHDYYKFYNYKKDGDYLHSLIATCRQEIVKLPAYSAVMPQVLALASRYTELQTYKHLNLSVRKPKMEVWANSYLSDYPDILFWEFAAASGSTLGIFILLAEASNPAPSPQEISRIFSAYFPWVCGLHILLDYLIDRNEDMVNDDLNFTTYYADSGEMISRLRLFIGQAFTQAETISQAAFTKTVIYGLIAMYLSDPKALHPTEMPWTGELLKFAGPYTKFLHTICLLLRKCKKI